jgi:hypothetical protein
MGNFSEEELVFAAVCRIAFSGFRLWTYKGMGSAFLVESGAEGASVF